VRIAFVVQRYGTEIFGGAEYHCRLIAERVAEHHHVDVLTTCARDYITWKNEYPEGVDRLRGVTVRRFANARTRDLASFNQLSDWIFHHRHSRQDEMEWLKQQGPWCPALIDYLDRQHQHYDVLVFFTYLYAPTVLGVKVAPSKSLLVPTAHDEPAIRLGIYEDLFASAAGFAWNTEVERRFVSSRFHLRALVEDVVGCGVDLPEGDVESAGEPAPATDPTGMGREPLAAHLEGPANAFRRRHRLFEPFALYGGRIDPGKGCEELLEYFQAYIKDGGNANLLLMGVKLMPLPDDPHVRFAGVLPEAERLHALEAARVVVVPSPHESLSLLALEAFAVGTPVLANARAEVLVEHCRLSQAGLYYGGRDEFVEALTLLMRDRALREAMGQNGKAYVQRHYRWSTILAKYERLFGRLRNPSHGGRDGRDGHAGRHGRDGRDERDGREPRDGRDARNARDPRDRRDSRDRGDRRDRRDRRDGRGAPGRR
jgi:glycosyltransferase involved in cell wall biosynthesis